MEKKNDLPDCNMAECHTPVYRAALFEQHLNEIVLDAECIERLQEVPDEWKEAIRDLKSRAVLVRDKWQKLLDERANDGLVMADA